MQNVNGATLLIAIAVGGAMGYFCGRMPYDAGMKRRRHGMATAGLILSVMCGLLGGCLLALPFALVFTAIITAMGEAPSSEWMEAGFDPSRRRSRDRDATPPPPVKPYTEIGHLVVCGACQKATSKENGTVPNACPHCDHAFGVKLPLSKRRSIANEDGIVALEVAEPPRRT